MASLKLKEFFCLLYTLLLFISGIVLIAFAAFLSYKLFYHFKFVPWNTTGPFITLLLLGFIHLFMTWLGFKGPSREHDFHIILFMLITIIILIIELCVGVWSIAIYNKANEGVVYLMEKSFKEFDFDKKDWAKLESKLKCCGLDGPNDYIAKNVIPYSCCNLEKVGSTCPDIFNIDCKQPMIKYVKQLLVQAACIGFISCIFQGIGLFVFITFFKSLKKERLTRRAVMQRQASPDNPVSNTPINTPVVSSNN